MHFEDKVVSITLGAYGSDASAIFPSTFNDVIKAEPSIIVEKFDKSLELKGAFNSCYQEKLITRSSVMLSITFHVPGLNISIFIRGIKFYIIDEEMDELFLGSNVLQVYRI